MTLPIVSIVVAAYNVERYLPQCLDSLLAQTYKRTEVIVVDDGSTDATAKVVADYEARDNRVVVVNQLNAGLSAARNAGLERSLGEYVAFVDGDDWVEPEMIDRMVDAALYSSATVTVSGAIVDFHEESDELLRRERRVFTTAYTVSKASHSDGLLADENTVNLLGYAWNKLYSRSFLEKNGYRFEEGLSLIEDIEFNARVLGNAPSVHFHPGAYVHYVQRPRPSLGKVRDVSFLSMRHRAILAVSSMLRDLGLDDERASRRSERAAGDELWQALRSVACLDNGAGVLRAMLDQPEASRLLDLAATDRSGSPRGRWASFMLRRRMYALAIVPARAWVVWARTKSRIVEFARSIRYRDGELR